MAKGSKQNGGDGDPHPKVLGRWGLWSRVLDGGRSSSSFGNGTRGLPRVDRQCELEKWMCHEVLELPVGSSWSKDTSRCGAMNGGMELGFWPSSTKLEITKHVFIFVFSPKRIGFYLQADLDSN
jgi:hypothetical protein